MKLFVTIILTASLICGFWGGNAIAGWAPGSSAIQNIFEDNKSTSFDLAMDDPVKWEIEQWTIGNIFSWGGAEKSLLTLFSINTYGGWDIGYDYHFN